MKGVTRLQWVITFYLSCLVVRGISSSEPLTFSINTKKWSHVLDDHFISLTVNPTDLLQGKAFGLGMNSTVAILRGLSPAYVRIGSADTGKYTFKRSRISNDAARTEDELIVTEAHWMVLNEVAQSSGLDIVVCLNAAQRNGNGRKWDTRNTLELISFSDSQGYNLTFQLGYEVQRSSGISGHQYGRDLNRLRTILNAFPRYQHSKLIGPDIKVLHKKEDVDFVNEVLTEAGQALDAVTWHPRWPQPSKMKVSDISDLGYEFPSDYLEWDKSQLNKVILQRSIYKSPIWIGEPKTESTGTFAEGLLWARRLVLAAKLGIEVVMKQPTLMDVSHPKPEYWIAFLHKRLLGKSVLETRAMNNHSDVAVVTHCTNSLFWPEKPERALEGSVTVYAVNMGGSEKKLHVKGTWTGKTQPLFQYLLTSGSDPDSVFSQMTYLNGEPLMMTDDGNLPDITPKIRKADRNVILKLPPYAVGFWVVPEARVRICQVQPASVPTVNLENLTSGNVMRARNAPHIRNVNQFIMDKLKNPVGDSEEEMYEDRIVEEESSEKYRDSGEERAPRSSRRVRQVTMDDIGNELREKIRDIREMLEINGGSAFGRAAVIPEETLRAAEDKIAALTSDLGTATRMTDQESEFDRFLHNSGLNQNFGALMMNGRKDGYRRNAEKNQRRMPFFPTVQPYDPIRRFRRSATPPEDDYEEEGSESHSVEEETETETKPSRKVAYRKRLSRLLEDGDESGSSAGYTTAATGLKGLEEKYRSFISNRVQNGKRKLSELRRLKSAEAEEAKRSGSKKPGNILGSDLHEEILMKEIEVLQKTEEAMANFIKNHKKRQQTIEEILLHEISDIKEDRLNALDDMRARQEDDPSVFEEEVPPTEEEDLPKKIRRSALSILQENLSSGRKSKRSIDEADFSLNGLVENSSDNKKERITKRSVEDTEEKTSRKRKSKRIRMRGEDSDERSHFGKQRTRRSRSERLDRMKNFIQSRERIRDRNASRKRHRQSLRKMKFDESGEDTSDIQMFDFAEKEDHQKQIANAIQDSETKAEMVKQMNPEKPNQMSKRVEVADGGDVVTAEKAKVRVEEKKSSPKDSSGPMTEKIDRNKGLNMLKRISSIVETVNTRQRNRSRNPSDVEDFSDEFYGDAISKMSKRRHRRSHHDGESSDEEEGEKDDSVQEEISRAQKKEMRRRKLLERISRKRKEDGRLRESSEIGSRMRARLQMKKSRKTTTETPVEESTTVSPEVQSETLEGKENERVEDEAVEMKAVTGESDFEKPAQETTTTEIPSTTQAEDKEDDSKEVEEKLRLMKNELEKKIEDVDEELVEVKKQIPPEGEGDQVEGEASLPKEEVKLDDKETEAVHDYADDEDTKVKSNEKEEESLVEKEEELMLTPEMDGMEPVVEFVPEITPPVESIPGKFATEHETYVYEMPEKSMSGMEEGSSVYQEEIVEESEAPREADYFEFKSAEFDDYFLDRNEEGTAGEADSLKRRRRSLLDRLDPTPEERIRNFKRIITGRQSPFKRRNEIPLVGEGENFWKKAGSTVKAVFNDVLPEAYGKTKDKIEDLGIADYFKEFGKIVEQMKNLDRLFANIGQAAVRNYIKGSEDEKGDYIQVIDKRHRSRRDVGETNEAATMAVQEEITETPKEAPEVNSVSFVTETTLPEVVTTTEMTKKTGDDRPNDLIKSIFFMDSNPGIVEVTEHPPTQELPPPEPLQPFRSRYSTAPKRSFFRNKITDLPTPRTNNIILNKMLSDKEPTTPEMQKFTPWMKTTKDFINQALTTLQRQRELTNMIARESVSDVIKKELSKKVIGKREAIDSKTEYKHPFPVYQVSTNRKREIVASQEGEAYPGQLQPGVYIVPTEEMKNLRSEQITKEAPPSKPGMPNVVTLNIYYDKKKPTEWSESGEAEDESFRNPDTYYQSPPNVAWNPVPMVEYTGQETPVDGQYLPPMHGVPERYGLPSSYRYRNQNGYRSLQRNQPMYDPMYYPGELAFGQDKGGWSDFRPATLPEANPYVPVQAANSGWSVHLQPTKKKASKLSRVSRPLERPVRPLVDKKRSIGKESTFSQVPLPVWKYFVSKKDDRNGEKAQDKIDIESSEDIFEENRKRARQNSGRGLESTTWKDESNSEEVTERAQKKRPAEQEGSRKKRSVEDGATKTDENNNSQSKPVLKSLNDEDSSLEVPGGENRVSAGKTEEQDPLTHFFKYAYDSLMQMMKGMTDLL